MTAETAAETVGPGRGGRRSRQRKREAVRRLLRGEEVALVLRAGRDRGDACGLAQGLLAGEASLATRPTNGAALEPIRQAVRRHVAGFATEAARGLSVRHDHGSPYLSGAFRKKRACLGIAGSPALVRAPEGNGCAGRFSRTLKENLLRIRSFDTVEQLRPALIAFREACNTTWLLERHGFRPPAALRAEQLPPAARAAQAPARCLTNRGRYTAAGAGRRADRVDARPRRAADEVSAQIARKHRRARRSDATPGSRRALRDAAGNRRQCSRPMALAIGARETRTLSCGRPPAAPAMVSSINQPTA